MASAHPLGSPSIETKVVGGHVVESKEIEVDGVRVGVIEGYIATWDVDTGGMWGVPDQFVRGAFSESLEEHRQRGDRQIRLKDHHGRTVGGFPIETAREDDRGLFAVGHINLEVQQGREAWALIKQGVLEDLSIGFSTLDDKVEEGIRLIFKAIVWEGSVVDEPANRGAQILAFKHAVPFQNLPLAPRDYAWDEKAARSRVSAFFHGKEFDEMEGAFLWRDREEEGKSFPFDYQIGDVIEGKLHAVPAAITGVAVGLREKKSHGTDDFALVQHVERYFAKMSEPSPFSTDQRQFVSAEDLKVMNGKEVEEAFRRGVVFSKMAARDLTKLCRADTLSTEAPCQEEKSGYDDSRLTEILGELRGIQKSMVIGRVLRT